MFVCRMDKCGTLLGCALDVQISLQRGQLLKMRGRHWCRHRWWCILGSWLHSWPHQELKERRPTVKEVVDGSRSADTSSSGASSFRPLSLRIEPGRV